MKKFLFVLILMINFVLGIGYAHVNASPPDEDWTVRFDGSGKSQSFKEYLSAHPAGAINYTRSNDGKVQFFADASFEPNGLSDHFSHLEQQISELQRQVSNQSEMIREIHDNVLRRGSVK